MMNALHIFGRAAVLRLLTIAATIAATIAVFLGGAPVVAAAGGPLSPEGTPAYAEWAVKSAWNYWNPKLEPGFKFSYVILKGTEIAKTGCGGEIAGDTDETTSDFPAGYCGADNTIYLSSQWLYNHATNGGTVPYGLANVIAHEVGHAVQTYLGLPKPTPMKPNELQADCFSGAWVGQQVRTGRASTKDARDARWSAQSLGDYEFDNPGHHGTADERVTAWTIGANRGPRACLALNPPAGR